MAVRGGTIGKICYCNDETGRRLGSRCLRLRAADGTWSKTHGAWVYQVELPKAADGKRRILRRVHHSDPASYAAAVGDLARVHELMALADGDPALADEIASLLMDCTRGKVLPDPRTLSQRLRSGVPNASSITVGGYLTWWVTHRTIDEHTRIGYESHVRVHLNPHLGHLRLYRLNTAHIEAMFATIARRNQEILEARMSADPAVAKLAQATRLTTAATMTRVRATLRKALNDAVAKHRLIDHNPALYVEMPQYNKPTVKVWTKRAIAQWRVGGFAPSPVMVWTPEQAGTFLDHTQVHDPELYALFLLIILGGPRRGEAVGIRTDQVDLDARTATFSHQLTQHGHLAVYKKVKTKSGDRVIFLDSTTIGDMRTYWHLREAWRVALGDSWPVTVPVQTPVPGGYVTVEVDLFFRQPDGRAWHPSTVTDRFMHDSADAGLPPIKLHGGRHAAATYMKAAGGDLLDLRKRLGHASITVTADIYPACLDEVDQLLAERTAALVPRQRTQAASTTEAAINDRATTNGSRAVPRAATPAQTADFLPRAHVPAVPPMVFQTPGAPAQDPPDDGTWPPLGRRRDRYPHDQR
jgi:integrase